MEVISGFLPLVKNVGDTDENIERRFQEESYIKPRRFVCLFVFKRKKQTNKHLFPILQYLPKPAATFRLDANHQDRFCRKRFEFVVFFLAASSNDKCQLAICSCDSVAALCFARNKLNPAYEDYPQSKCK